MIDIDKSFPDKAGSPVDAMEAIIAGQSDLDFKIFIIIISNSRI